MNGMTIEQARFCSEQAKVEQWNANLRYQANLKKHGPKDYETIDSLDSISYWTMMVSRYEAMVRAAFASQPTS